MAENQSAVEFAVEFSIKSGGPDKQRSSCVVVGVYEGRGLSPSAELLDKASGGVITEICRRDDMDGKVGSTLLLYGMSSVAANRVLLVGFGKKEEISEAHYRDACQAAASALCQGGIKSAALCLPEMGPEERSLSWCVRQLTMLLGEARYRFHGVERTPPPAQPKLEKVTLVIDRRADLPKAEAALQQGMAIVEGQSLARTLGNLPGNICTPDYLANEARRMAETFGLDCDILEMSHMSELGMGALLSVAKGSAQPPKLIALSYRGKGKAKPVVLVGKGITFDSGGISLKPGADMDEMKFDMCGAASVLGTMQAVARLALPINLTVIVPACENMPGGRASKPGDVVTSMSGKTIEILNTDAEGRLILCDALTYAKRFQPEEVIDVATLTGACVIALGSVVAGLFANHQPLAEALLGAGKESYDRVWQMPLWDDYRELLKSNFADMANIGGRYAGSITAACFLSRFTEDYRWAHLDIAGVANKSGKEKGATGRPVPLLTHYLLEKTGQLF